MTFLPLVLLFIGLVCAYHADQISKRIPNCRFQEFDDLIRSRERYEVVSVFSALGAALCGAHGLLIAVIVLGYLLYLRLR